MFTVVFYVLTCFCRALSAYPADVCVLVCVMYPTNDVIGLTQTTARRRQAPVNDVRRRLQRQKSRINCTAGDVHKVGVMLHTHRVTVVTMYTVATRWYFFSFKMQLQLYFASENTNYATAKNPEIMKYTHQMHNARNSTLLSCYNSHHSQLTSLWGCEQWTLNSEDNNLSYENGVEATFDNILIQ